MQTEKYFVFPDIHGHFAALKAAFDWVDSTYGPSKIIFLGDYIDRGPDNVRVLDFVMNPPEGYEFICLAGNHEDMLIKEQVYDGNAILEMQQSPKGIYHYIDWMKTLQYFHFEDNNVFAHAWYDIALPLDQQDNDELCWHRMSDAGDWKYGINDVSNLYLTHGHTPRTSGPTLATMRCNLDAGAVFGGPFVVATFEPGKTGPQEFTHFNEELKRYIL